MSNPEFIYTTYMKTTPEKVWQAITTPEFTRQYWVHENISDWKKGSKWQHLNKEKQNVMIVGEVLETVPPTRLVLSWADPKTPDDKSRVTFEINAINKDMVCLKVTHDKLVAGSKMMSGISTGWPLVLSNLKSFLETGKPFDLMAAKLTDCSKDVA